MATILFVGGVSPDATQEELRAAFGKVDVLASSLVRAPGSRVCVGHAYVTVASEHVVQATAVTEVGTNRVCVFPVEVEAWVAPMALQVSAATAAADPSTADAGAAAAAAAIPGAGQCGPGGSSSPPAPAPAWSGPEDGAGPGPCATGPAAMAARAALAAFGSSAGPSAVTAPAVEGGSVAVPHTVPGNTHLQSALDLLRFQLGSNPRTAYNGKRFATLLNEVSMKRQQTQHVAEAVDAGGFRCTISLINGTGAVVCAGTGTAANKKDAKHSAAAACINNLIACGQLPAAEVVSSLTCIVAPAAPGAPNFFVEPTPGATAAADAAATSPAITSAMAQTQTIKRLGVYPRASEVMDLVYGSGSEAARVKTFLMVLNEFAARHKMMVHHEELASSTGPSPLAGPFRFVSRLVNVAGATVAQAAGVELRSKQEAKHASAAALLNNLIDSGQATVEGIARGR